MSISADNKDYKILIIDDDREITFMFKDYLSEVGFITFMANSAAEGEEIFNRENIDVILLDINMPKVSGFMLLEQFKQHQPEIIIIMISAIQDIDMVVKCMHLGAYDYLVKPIIELNHIKIRIDRALEDRKNRLENITLKQKLDDSTRKQQIIGQSSSMRKVFDLVKTVAPYDSTVLVSGASGTGKELIARRIHDLSKRKDESFIAVNCGSVPATLLESTLFGHEKGSFTGASKKRIGLFEESNHGTIFLDEITETSLDFQIQLLRVLENNTIRRVGGDKEIALDLRIIAATNQDIEKLIKKGKFREDLFYRLNVFMIRLPSLSERRGDIPLIVDHFLPVLAIKMDKYPLQIENSVMEIFKEYPWQGNVRELINTLENTIIRCNSNKIKTEHLPENFSRYKKASTTSEEPPLYQKSFQDFEYDYFKQLLDFTGGNITRAASIAGFARQHLHLKLKKLNLK